MLLIKPALMALATALGALALHAASPEKTIYAHYMGCYPTGYGPIEYHWRNQAGEMRHDSTDFLAANGGRIVNWPLWPQGTTLTPEQSAELEIKQAIRGGIDGFAVDAWAGKEFAKQTLDHLFAAAERLDVPFFLTVCLDPASHEKRAVGNHIDTYTETIKWLLEKHGDSPHLARRDGKVLIFGYGSTSIIFDQAFKALPETPAKWEQISDAYKQVETNVGRPIFFHFGFDNLGSKKPEIYREAAVWAGKNFDAVGGFLGNYWDADQATIDAIKAGGAEWSQPLFFQYNNKGGSLWVEPGTDMLRRAYQRARDSDSTLIQFVTWNDYGEDTVLAPGYSTNYTILSLNRHLVDWWKQGHEPKVGKDQLHLIFRRAPEDATTFPFQTRRIASGPVLEVATMLTAPGEVTVPGYDVSYQAPAGLFIRQFPLRVGRVRATLSRDGATVLDVLAPEEVTDKPFREDNSMACFSSNFMDEWRADFGDAAPLLYSDNGDMDGDGLPNWFEMYYFGKFPDMRTASGANPGDDPDKDGLTNLQEYQNRTDPKTTGKPYAAGFIWDFTDIQKRGISFGPDRDSHQRDVWFYFYKHGEARQIPHDGHYVRMPSVWSNVPYAGKMAHLSPAQDPDGKPYRYLHGWIAHRQMPDGRWQIMMRPRANAAVILGWQSPVDGTVNVSFDAVEVAGIDPIVLEISRNTEAAPLHSEIIPVGNTARVELAAVAVKKGDFLYLVADGKPRTDSSFTRLENLKVELETIHE
ncbi:MAG: endo-1,3-alpha-glucanase family glycosylhydrolase [Verrucomicrobiota bacterium]